MADQLTLAVGIDGSEHSARALAWAAREAHRRSCRLRVVHAYSIPAYAGDFGVGAMAYPAIDLSALQQSHQTIVDDQLADVRAAYPSLDVETVVKAGWAVAVVLDNSLDAELTVIGSHGAGSLAALFLGSVAHGVAHRSTVPVVLVPNAPVPATIRNISVATDGSESAQAAVAWAADEAERWGAELTLIHAWDYPYVGPRTGTVEPAELMELDAAHLMTAAMSDLRSSRPNLHAAVHAKIVKGPVVSAIVDAAKGSDLLVVGARGRGAVRSIILGSTSNATIHRVSSPLVVVHSPSSVAS